MKYRIQQKTTSWVEVSVEAANLEEALLAAEEKFIDGNFTQSREFEFEDEYWWEDEQGKNGTL